MNNPNTDELYHYGVKGMKWGVRRKRDVSDFNTSYVKTSLNKRGKITSAGDYSFGNNKAIFKYQDKRAVKKATKEGKAYEKAVKKSGKTYDESKKNYVVGNKYRTEIDNYREKNAVIGNKKLAKIDRERDYYKSDKNIQKSTISEGIQDRNALKAKRLPMESTKANIDNKLLDRNNYWTQSGYDGDRKKTEKLGKKISDIQRDELANEARIARAMHQLDISKRKLSELDNRYAYVARAYLGI